MVQDILAEIAQAEAQNLAEYKALEERLMAIHMELVPDLRSYTLHKIRFREYVEVCEKTFHTFGYEWVCKSGGYISYDKFDALRCKEVTSGI